MDLPQRHKNRSMEQKILETDQQIHSHLTFDQGTKLIQWLRKDECVDCRSK